MRVFASKVKNSDEDFWSSVSDLMAGLMILFLFIAISYMTMITKENIDIKKEKQDIQQQQEAIIRIVDTYEDIKMKIYEDLYAEFKLDFIKWKAVIDQEDLTVRFEEPEVFFERGKSTLNTLFKEILSDFFPRYINVLYSKYQNDIEEIRIEGYTSSEWNGSNGALDAYFKNMELSQGRTRNVLEYILNLRESESYKDWIIEHLTANGMSYSHRYFDQAGKEDKKKSRRVEFKIKTSADKIILDIVEKYRNEGLDNYEIN